MLPPEVHEFLNQASSLTTQQWSAVRTERLRLAESTVEAVEALGPSASRSSEIERATRDALAPHSATIKAAGRFVYSGLIGTTRWACTAIMTREKLTAEQYEVLVHPFVAAGLTYLLDAPPSGKPDPSR